MSEGVDPDLLVLRTCTTRDDSSGRRESRPLEAFRDTPAFVLLGDPGSGKTESFRREAAATGGHYVRARDFVTLDPSPRLAGKTLFIDGLDEMRAAGGDGRTPLDHIRRHLDRLGRPAFRLSCREADWYGDSDSAALRDAAPQGALAVLHLDPLSDDDVAMFLKRKFGVADPVGFVKQAERHGLADLLHNPQTLALLAHGVGETWPSSRRAIYELACRQLACETNREHRAARRSNAPTVDALLEAAGFLSAVQLLAGIAGFALDDNGADQQHVLWRNPVSQHALPRSDALASGLFQRDEREQQRIPVHRSIAEFLGAHYLADLVDTQGLPLGRIVSLMAGEDDGIVPDLRGLGAWLAVHCRAARDDLVGRDPLGVVLYGDVRDFPLEDKRRVLATLKAEADRYANFRFEDWTAAPFGALATPDMVPVFLELLASPSRAEAHIALIDCALDALNYGPPLVELTQAAIPDALAQLDAQLDTVARDPSYPSHIRSAAIGVHLRNPARRAAQFVTLAKDVFAGAVVDDDDQLLGLLLEGLYPEHIPPSEVLDYLRPTKNSRLLGSFHRFWWHRLSDATPDDVLPTLLDGLSRRDRSRAVALRELDIARMAGELLARAVETHGDTVDGSRLYDWLSTGLDERELPRIDAEHKTRVAKWLGARPERYKAVLREGASRCIAKEDVNYCLYRSMDRLYGAEPPTDIAPWYLAQAALETHAELARHFFGQAVVHLVRQGGQGWLTLEALEFLEPWLAAHPEFEPGLEGFGFLPIDHWQREATARDFAWQEEDRQRKQDWLRHFQRHVDSIRESSVHPKVLHDLAQAYLVGYVDIRGDTPHERLVDFLGGDRELIDAAYAGFRCALDRDDLPSVAEIIDLERKGRMHYIRQPCLVGIEELYRADPGAALRLRDEVLRKLLAFQYTWIGNEDAAWFDALVRTRPTLVAEVLIAYALPLLRKGREHVNGIWPLAYDEAYADVARAALPDLLGGFPLRAKNQLLGSALDPLLKAALHRLDRDELATIIAYRLARGSMSAAQRVHWLGCALVLAPDEYEAPLAAHVGTSKALAAHLGAFLHDHEWRSGWSANLPETTLALLIELLAPDAPPERPMEAHCVSPAMQTAEEVRAFIDALGGNPSEAASQQLERLLAVSKLVPWHNRLRHAVHTQRIARRKAGFRRLDAAEVSRTLANREPANAADLAALAHAHLRDLARKIRDGSTNDYRQYWSYDSSGKPERSKPENDCRDILLSDLAERLGRLGVDAIKEGYYAEDRRADIRVAFGGAARFNVPIEIKKDSHSDLWRAIREQLIERYTRDPGAEGFGIYLVFWFGGKNMPLPQEGKKPRSAAEVEAGLGVALTSEESRRILICVIDCALP